jgi:uncharacterized protein involved in exopolysaccharide biosynthesis
MSVLLFLLDVRPQPVGETSWLTLMLLLGIVLILSVAFAGGLVFLLIRFKRRKQSRHVEIPGGP